MLLNTSAAADASREFLGIECPHPHALRSLEARTGGRTGISFDGAQVREFVSLIGLPLMVLSIDSTKQRASPEARTCTTVDEVVAAARAWNKEKRNLYWLPNDTALTGKKPAKIDMTAARYAWADCDPDIKQHGSYEAARNHLLTTHAAKLAPSASFVIDSGNGLQAFFKLATPLSLAGGFACDRRSESDTRWRRRSEMRNDSCSAELFGACCRWHRWAVSGASKGARRASADAPGAARFRKG
jgi:hypothetical protein